MNLFDKICAAFAFIFGILFLILGCLGLFMGASANFTLPPVLGFFQRLSVGESCGQFIWPGTARDLTPLPRTMNDSFSRIRLIARRG